MPQGRIQNEDLGVSDLSLVKKNGCCWIYQARSSDGPLIVKHYYPGREHLMEREAHSLSFHHGLVERFRGTVMDVKPIKMVHGKNLLAISYVDGESFSRFLYRSVLSTALQEQAITHMRSLGEFLRFTHDESRQVGGRTSPFVYEYVRHCAHHLESLPLIGAKLFAGSRSRIERMIEHFESLEVPPTFSHGDLVFRNIHVNGDAIGLIDFGNSNPHGHVLNDVYSLRFALEAMYLPALLKGRLVDALEDGMGDLPVSDEVHRFYREFNRIRWLNLSFRCSGPLGWIKGLRGLNSFARPD